MVIKCLDKDIRLYDTQLLEELEDKLRQGQRLSWGYVKVKLESPSLEDFSNWIEKAADAASVVTTPDLKSDKKSTRSGGSVYVASESPSKR